MLVVMIGRNIGARPMPIAKWHRFRAETSDALGRLGTVVTRTAGRYVGTGQWPAEDTALFVVDTVLGSGAAQDAIGAVLQRYGQLAAGYVEGSFTTGG